MRRRTAAVMGCLLLLTATGCKGKRSSGATDGKGGPLGRVVSADRVDPADVQQTVQVAGMKWIWIYTMEGDIERDELWLRPGLVRLDLTSKDEPHRFDVDALGLQATVKPGETTTVYVEVTGEGEGSTGPDDTCPPELAELDCMATKILALDAAAFERKVAQQRGPLLDEGETWASFGRAVYERNGCTTCHGGLEKTGVHAGMAPGLGGIAGTARPVQGKGEVTADAAYLERALVDPGAEVTEGFENIQPTFAGVLSEGEIRGLVEAIQCAGTAPPTDVDCG